MVGSGFSRNAESIHPGKLVMPTWAGIAEEIYGRLYPNKGNLHGTLTATASFETSSALRLAQEYKAAFGPTDLNSLLLDLIRDGAFKPGRMHERLLRLPWRDVFTTNWDTLLERACSEVTEQSYGLLRTADEIPLAARPRIVKLHGSVNAHFPLIVTEEDYRTYPVKFAPFVNTVQQAMMETVFCLIGFKGDDPNFLHWSGWVRDNLGASAPKIYLAGWLGLSTSRRRMLEDRNVIPIDLARHPNAGQWPEEFRHERSTDWILHTLEYGHPYDPAEWPSTLDFSRSSVPEYLEPVDRKTTKEPKAEPPPTLGNQAPSKTDSVRALLDVWNHNRSKTYPGWLTAPSDIRANMLLIGEKAPRILEVIPSLSVVERLNALRELLWWLWEIQQEPMSSSFEETALNVLTLIDCQNRKIDGESDTDADWSAITEAWVAVTFALVQAARFRFDEEEFNKRLSMLLPFQNTDQDIGHRIHHEQCLWSVYSLDYSSMEDLVDDWHVEDCDPVWMMRKAALLLETGHNEKARELNYMALTAIRSVPPDDNSVAFSSREAWALYCAGAALKQEDFRQAWVEWKRRWDELTPLKCNALLEMQRYAEAIRGVSDPEKGAHFDLGKVWKSGLSFSKAEFRRWQASHRFVRAIEVLGLPPSGPSMQIASQNLELAAKQLRLHEPELAARIVLRAAEYKATGTLNFVLSRNFVAAMPQESVDRLAQDCVNAIEFMLSQVSEFDADRHWERRLLVVVEGLSRFVLRLEADRAESIFSRALHWYEHKSVASIVGIRDPIMNILSRAWEALPVQRKPVRVLDLLNAPIVGMDGFRAGIVGDDEERHFEKQYPDPCEVLDRSTVKKFVTDSYDEAKWQETIKYLVRGLQSSEEARKRASRRVGWLLDLHPVSENEQSEIALALWGEDYSSNEDLPTGTDIFDWAFSVLPEPKPGLAERRFRAKWLNPDLNGESSPPKLDAVLWNVGSAIHNLKIHGKPLSFSEAEQSYLEGVVGQWARISPPAPLRFDENPTPMFLEGEDEVIRNAIYGLSHVLLEIEISEAVANSLYEKIQRLNESEFPARAVLVGLSKALPERFEDIAQSIRMGLAADDEKTAQNAVAALKFWLHFEKDAEVGLNPPPIDLVKEIGVIIANRRRVALIQALNIARWAYKEGSSEYRSAIGSLAVQGLDYLEEELRYNVSNEEDSNVPLLRSKSVQLAIAMAEYGFDSKPAVARWIESAKDDPLPEVRYAKNQ